MTKSKQILSWALALASMPAWADQVTLKNGDRVTGEILKKDGPALTIKTPFMGTVTMPWEQVSAIASDAPLTVVLPSGPVRASVATGDGKIQLQGRAEPVPLTDVVALRNDAEQKEYERHLHPGWTQLWAGTASLGLAGTAGNSRTATFTTGINAARVTGTDKTSIYFNAIKSSALVSGKNSETAQAVRGGFGYDHNVRARLFATAFNDYEYDRFQNLDLRFVAGGGLGFHAMKTKRSQLDLLGGADYNHSKFSTPLTQNTVEGFAGNDYSLKLTRTTSLIQSFRVFDDLQDTGTYRVNFDAGATTKVSKWLNWNVSLSDRYLSHPAPGRKTNDFLYTTGLGITFAR